MSDVVLRLRVTRTGASTSATLDFKGAASYEAGYKHREETSVPIGNAGQMAGILTALLGQGLSPEDAMKLGVYLHGYIGDRVAESKGPIGLLASDIIDGLPRALAELAALPT